MNFLGRARQMFQGWKPAEPPRPQYYNVACPEGHRLRGERTDGYQALRCPECGGGIFVLPRSPLPEPPPPTTKPRAAHAAALLADDGPILLSDPPPRTETVVVDDDEVVDAEIEWIDPAAAAASLPPGHVDILDVDIPMDAAPAPASAPAPAASAAPRARPHGQRRPQAQARAAAPGHAGQARPVAAAARPMIEVVDRPGLGAWLFRHRLGLIVTSVVLIVAGTVVVRIRQKQREQYPAIIEAGRTEGLPALDQGEFDIARRKLGAAARAVEALGGASEGADAILQGAREADIFVDLVPRSLEELIDEAAREDDERAWQQRFNSVYRGRSILFDDNVADYRILSPRGLKGPRVGRIDTTGLKLLQSTKPQPGESRHVYGARLAAITFKDGEWLVTLEPESGVVMTHWDALKAFGWGATQEEDNAP